MIECPSKDIKNIVCRIIRCKIKGNAMRSNADPPNIPTPPGVTAEKSDYKVSARCSDAKLQYRPGYVKLNAATTIVSHAASLIKSVCSYKSYDCMPIWSGGKPQLLISLKFDIGPLGPRVTLDPEKLIAPDTQAVLNYVTTQLTAKYPDLISVAAKWATVRRDLAKTIDNTYTVFLNQSTVKKSNKDNSEPASEQNNE